jgi:hypothetical protein
MKAHGIDCCQRTPTRGGWAAGGVTLTALSALMPKCPMCFAAWLGVLGLSGLAARINLRVLLFATAFAVAACSALVVHRFLTGKETRS